MLAGVAINVVVVLANVALLATSGWFITAMGLAGLGLMTLNYFTPAAAIRGLAILRTLGRYVERLVTHEATFRLIAGLRVWFYRHLEPLAPARLQHYRGGDLLSRIRADIDNLDNLYLRVVAPTAAALISSVVLVWFMARFSGAIALVDAAGLTIAGVALPLASRRLGRSPGRRAVTTRADLRSAVADGVRGLGELAVCGAVATHAARVAGGGRALTDEGRSLARIGAVTSALSGLAAQLALWGALVLAIPLVRSGALAGPELAMVALFVLASFEAVSPLPLAFGALGETLEAARRIFEVVDAMPAVRDPVRPATAPRRFDIKVRGLRMRYHDGGPWALDGIDLDVPQGGSIGIVGPSGAGKTSLLNVLLRFWEYQEGTVEIGGVALRDLDSSATRNLCAVVAQDTHLFNATVRDNLLLARPDASADDLRAVLTDVGILGEIEALPRGLDTLVGETGTRFSGGQTRRIAIARALLKDAPILVLDEPTEGLDAASERAVLHALDRLMAGRTTLLVTHRPQALRHVDAVVHLDPSVRAMR
jgi:ATP-binding cassette subfamily C protein CydC